MDELKRLQAMEHTVKDLLVKLEVTNPSLPVDVGYLLYQLRLHATPELRTIWTVPPPPPNPVEYEKES